MASVEFVEWVEARSPQRLFDTSVLTTYNAMLLLVADASCVKIDVE